MKSFKLHQPRKRFANPTDGQTESRTGTIDFLSGIGFAQAGISKTEQS